jgi:NitT/TauT family transport system substrate-binding protein
MPLRIGIDLWAGYYPLVLADELGYLKSAGVEVEISIPKNTDRMLAQFAARDYDAVCVSCADVITVTRAVPHLRIVLLSDESAGGDQVLARHPVTTAEDLRGKKIGTNLGGFGELFVQHLLAKYGVSPSEVTLVNVEAAEIPRRLAAGELDLGHTWEPYATEAQQLGMQAVFTSKDTPGLILDGLVFDDVVVEQRNTEVRALVKAWFRAVDWWRQHPEEGDRRIETKLHLQPGQARPLGIRLLDREDNRLQMAASGGPAPLQICLQNYIDFFAARGLLLQRPAPQTMFGLNLLP